MDIKITCWTYLAFALQDNEFLNYYCQDNYKTIRIFNVSYIDNDFQYGWSSCQE